MADSHTPGNPAEGTPAPAAVTPSQARWGKVKEAAGPGELAEAMRRIERIGKRSFPRVSLESLLWCAVDYFDRCAELEDQAEQVCRHLTGNRKVRVYR